VAELIDETMGLIPIGVLCIFLRKYSCAGLGWAGGRQYLAILGERIPSFLVGLFYL